ncbi:MAG: hypothetical protein NTZ69_18970 [Bacteroidia bacterium]|nr:hypothetical protein [Bacteroidia bacterium]
MNFKNGKTKWTELYSQIPEEILNKILLRTDTFDRIGPIELPLRIFFKENQEPTKFILYYYGFYKSGENYFLLTQKESLMFDNPIVRVSSNCNWAFDLRSMRCDCEWELEYAKKVVSEESDQDGLIIFALDQHGKSITGGIRGHALIYALGQIQKQDLVYAAYKDNGFRIDYREYDEVISILKSLNINKMRFLSNNPEKIEAFTKSGFGVTRVPIEKPYDKNDSEELGVKKIKLGHHLNLENFNREDISIYGLDPSKVFNGNGNH